MVEDGLGRRGRLGCYAATIAFAVVGLGCLIHTRRSLSGTFDESNHLATGLEWWQFGSYSQWTENPPLPRLAIAALPYLHGMRLPAPADWDPRTHDWDRSWEVGNDLLCAGDGFEANLQRARRGTLPFFVLALVAAWGDRDPCDPKSRYHEGEVAPGAYAWLKAYAPVAIVGGSIRLYHIAR